MTDSSPNHLRGAAILIRITRLIPDDYRQLIKTSWAVSWPMTLIMSFEFFNNLADVFIAGMLGKEYQATVGLVIQVYMFFVVVGNAMTVGTVSLVSRLATSGKSEECGRSVFTVLVSSLGLGLVVGGMLTAFSPYIVALLAVPEELKELAVPLLRIYGIGLVFHYVLLNTNGILRASKRVRLSAITMLIVSITNVSLNFLLTLHTPLGFRGIAVSTAVAALVGALINSFHVKRIIAGVFSYSVDVFRRVAKIGWPMGVLQMAWQLGSTVLFLILARLPERNVEVMAAFTNGMRMEAAIYMPAFALNMANAVVVGNLLGEDNRRDAFRGGLVTAFIGVGIVSVMTVLIIANAPLLASTLSPNDVVIDETVRYLYISMIAEPIMAFGVILGGGLNGAGDTRSVMRYVALSIWLVRIPLAFITGVVLHLGPAAVWWSMNASIVVQTSFIARRYFSRTWLKDT